MEFLLLPLLLFAIWYLPYLLVGLFFLVLGGLIQGLSRLFDPPKKPSYSTQKNCEPAMTIISTIQDGYIQTLRFLLKSEGENPNQCDETGETPLMLAARKGRVEALQLLIEAGADLDARNEAGQTALFLAVMKEHTEAVRVLIEAGADINAMTPEGETPLDAAKRPDIVRLLETAGGF